MTEHVGTLKKAKEKLIGYRRELAALIASPESGTILKNHIEDFVSCQAAIEAVENAIEEETNPNIASFD